MTYHVERMPPEIISPYTFIIILKNRTLETQEKDGHNSFRLRTDDLIPESAVEEK
jgi:hypothetical protein